MLLREPEAQDGARHGAQRSQRSGGVAAPRSLSEDDCDSLRPRQNAV